jgi:hypothetical protein
MVAWGKIQERYIFPELPPMVTWPQESNMTGTRTFSMIGVLTEPINDWSARLYKSAPSKRFVTAIVVWSRDRHDLPLGNVRIKKMTLR